MKTLSREGQERLFALLSQGFKVYNAFAPGPEGEATLLKLRDDLTRHYDAGDSPETPVTVTLPFGLIGFMMAAAKQLGDQCMQIKRLDEDGILFQAEGNGKQ